MSARVTRVLWCAAVIAVASAARCPAKKAAVKPTAAAKSNIPDSADQILFGVRHLLTYRGVAQGELLSDTLITYDDGSRLDMRRVNVTFYTKQGLKDGVMTSRTGLYNTRLSRLEVTGDVVVSREDGSRLTSPELVYDEARNQIFSDTSFVLNKPGEQTLSGIGFESDPRLTRFRCLRACKGAAPVNIPLK